MSRSPVHRMRARWRVSLKPRRLMAKLRVLAPLRPGCTVVIVNWNSLDHLRVSVRAVPRMSPAGTRLIVVDNGSTDGSLDWLRSQKIRTIALPTNMGHGPALDIGFLSASTEFVLALDVDAFPISPRWLDELTVPLVDGTHVVGAHGGAVLGVHVPAGTDDRRDRDFVHPCCLAMRLRRFVQLAHSFMKVPERGLDVGERIAEIERGHLRYLEPTSFTGPGFLGTVFGGIVYHNFYSTRYRRESTVNIDGVSAEDARRVWRENVALYLGDLAD